MFTTRGDLTARESWLISTFLEIACVALRDKWYRISSLRIFGARRIAILARSAAASFATSAAQLRILLIMPNPLDFNAMLAVAIAEARKGLAEGGIPIGAAIFDEHGKLMGSGHNRRVQNGDPSLHGETDAFRNAGRQRSYKKLTMVTTLAPCWYCSGLVRQFGFARVVVGESRTFQGGIEWLRSLGIEAIDLDSQECVTLLSDYMQKNPAVWNEDIGEDS